VTAALIAIKLEEGHEISPAANSHLAAGAAALRLASRRAGAKPTRRGGADHRRVMRLEVETTPRRELWGMAIRALGDSSLLKTGRAQT